MALTRNTTDDLVDDINRLRDALGITGKMHVFGGSWGSTLALVYAIRHPQTRGLADPARHLPGRARGHCLPVPGQRGDLCGSALRRSPSPGSYITYPDEWRAFLEADPAGPSAAT